MPKQRPSLSSLIGQPFSAVPASAQRVLQSQTEAQTVWIDSDDAAGVLSKEEATAYAHAHTIMRHIAVQAPIAHQSGHPGGPLSAFTFSYFVSALRNPQIDQPYRFSAGHLSLLSYTLQYLFGREGNDPRLASVQSIIDTFRTPSGLPGHVEAGIGDIPFGTGPLGKGPSNALGVAFGLKFQKKAGIVDVLLADGDSQEGQVMEAFRLAAHLQLDNLMVHGDFNDVQLSGLPTKTVAADFASIAAATGWYVIEVQNGNDPAQVKAALLHANEQVGKGKPIFLCYYTTMGHGISLMEDGSNTGKKNFHGAPLSKEEAEKALVELPLLESAISEYEAFRKNEKKRFCSAQPTVTDIPLEWSLVGYDRTVMDKKGAARKDLGAVHLLKLMQHDPRIVVLHADLAGSGGFDVVEKALPNRVINVGVAEANMYMMAAGMRQTGLLPVTYTFAAFGMNEARANARLIDINCGHTRCAVFHDCTHAGLSVGEDGETHQEQNYLNIPFHHTQVWIPGDSNQAGAMAERGLELVSEGHTNVYVFSSRTGHEQLKTPAGDIIYGKDYVFDGRANLLRGQGDSTDQVTILAAGVCVHTAITIADQLAARENPIIVRVLNVASIRPLDATAIIEAALETRHLIVIEDHNVDGGLATQVADVIADFSLPCSLRRLGLTHYLPSGSAEDLAFIAGIDADSLLDAVEDEIRKEVCGGEDAFVTAIHQLTHNARTSRFRESAQTFIQKLLQEQEYLPTLRDAWQQRTCSSDELPKNSDLLERLENAL